MCHRAWQTRVVDAREPFSMIVKCKSIDRDKDVLPQNWACHVKGIFVFQPWKVEIHPINRMQVLQIPQLVGYPVNWISTTRSILPTMRRTYMCVYTQCAYTSKYTHTHNCRFSSFFIAVGPMDHIEQLYKDHPLQSGAEGPHGKLSCWRWSCVSVSVPLLSMFIKAACDCPIQCPISPSPAKDVICPGYLHFDT